MSIIATVAAAATTTELTGMPLVVGAVKGAFLAVPALVFAKAGLFVGVSIASAYVLISRFKRMRKMQEIAEQEETRNASPLLFEHDEDVSPAERALGVDNIVNDPEQMEELDRAMDEVRAQSPRRARVQRVEGKKKKGKKGKKKLSKKAKKDLQNLRDGYDYNALDDVRIAGRRELERWTNVFRGFTSDDIDDVDDAARDLGLM